jgi:hypothetical protein
MPKHKNWDADDDSGDSGEGRRRARQKCPHCEDGLVTVEYDGEKGGKDGAGSGTSFARCKVCGGTGKL